MASAASRTLMRLAAFRNAGGFVPTSRSSINASCTSGWLTRCSGTALYAGITFTTMHMRFAIIGTVLVAVMALAIVLTQSTQREVSIVIANGTVITMTGEGQIVENGAIAIDGTDIVAVG